MKATTYIESVQTVMQMNRAGQLHGSMLEVMNIQGATGLTHTQAATLKALGAIASLCDRPLGTRCEHLNSVLSSQILHGEIWGCLADLQRFSLV